MSREAGATQSARDVEEAVRTERSSERRAAADELAEILESQRPRP